VRYAIISDIHANLQAWNAVITDVQSSNVSEILCLGDVVGYGPNPADVLEQAYARVHHFVLGNHDAVVCGKLNPVCFNQNARALIEWTREHLDAKASDFFRNHAYSLLEGPNFRCAHGDPSAPMQYRYVIDPADALPAWECCTEQLLFVGHSHVPGIFVIGGSGTPHWLKPQGFALEEGKRYIVNVGSVGQPRDGDVRACYCIYDSATESIDFRRVPFDIEAYREELRRVGLPSEMTHFLHVAESTTPKPLREMLDFHPPDEPDPEAGDVAVARLEGAVKAARRWRSGAVLLLALLISALCVAGFLWRSRDPGLTTYEATGRGRPEAAAPAVGEQWLAPLQVAGAVGPENRLAEWTVALADPERQSVATETWTDPSGRKAPSRVFHIRSEAPLAFRIASAPAAAAAGARFQVLAGFRELRPTAGHIELCLVRQGEDGLESPVVVHPIQGLPAGRWSRRSKTGGELLQDGAVRWVLRGRFAGELLLRDCSLVRKK